MQRPVGVPDNRKVINKKTGEVYRAKDHEEKSIAIAEKEKKASKSEVDNIIKRLGLIGLSLSDLPVLNEKEEKSDDTLEGKNKDKNKDPNKGKTQNNVDPNKVQQDTPKV